VNKRKRRLCYYYGMPYAISKLKEHHFPPLLREINDPPKALYLRGSLPMIGNIILTVVGSRKYSNYGKDVCEKLIAGLRGYPITIVSGLALGMDSIAHTAALAAELQTIAVPGSGLSDAVLYPASNQSLARTILAKGGGLLSEYEPNFKATTWSFPQRNRIMAGMSKAVLIIEAQIKSGTLITSKLATEYNRDVFTVPGSIFSTNSEGPHMLLRLGATPITSSKDLLEALGFTIEDYSKIKTDTSDYSPEEIRILKILVEPLTRDELVRELDISTSQANILLSLMEIKGLIKESMGKIYIT
jgi:DNA processing protein